MKNLQLLFILHPIEMNSRILFTAFTLLITFLFSVQAQVPQQFNYQAVLRNNRNVVVNDLVLLRFTIHDGSPTGTVDYQEEHNATTDEYGLVNVTIGTGNVLAGDFTIIDWSDGAKYLQVEVNRGSGYTDMGTQQIRSVPYALYAESTGGGGWQLEGNVANGTDFIGTTNIEALRFKQNNAPAGYIDGDLTAFGVNALSSNTSGYRNTAIGQFTLFKNTLGHYNTAIGRDAMYSNTTGYRNTAIGVGAMFSNTTGHGNTAIGEGAMHDDTSGYYNTAIGRDAMYSNTNGYYNTAIGEGAMYSNTTGYRNTAIGRDAMHSNTIGYYNTAIGERAMYSNTTGYRNTAIGIGAMFFNTTGFSNTVIGRDAMHFNTTGYLNTAIGYFALDVMSGNAYQNTGIGTNVTIADDVHNSTAIGYNAYVGDTNTIVIGNTEIESIGGYAPWSEISDTRFKTRMQPLSHGLDFIMKLKPITYHMNMQKLHNFMERREGEAAEEDSEWLDEAMTAKAAIQYTGFSAQQVEQVAQSLGYKFSGVNAPENELGHYTLAYSTFVVPLVKAVQEQQAMIVKQQKSITHLQETNNSQQKTITKQQELIEQIQQSNKEILARLIAIEQRNAK